MSFVGLDSATVFLRVSLCKVLQCLALTAHTVIAKVSGHVKAALAEVEV